MDLAIKVLAVVLGFIAAVWSYSYFDAYVVALVAFAGAVAVGVLVGVLVDRGLRALFNDTRL